MRFGSPIHEDGGLRFGSPVYTSLAVITSAPATVASAEVFTLSVKDSSTVQSVTYAGVSLAFTAPDATTLTVTMLDLYAVGALPGERTLTVTTSTESGTTPITLTHEAAFLGKQISGYDALEDQSRSLWTGDLTIGATTYTTTDGWYGVADNTAGDIETLYADGTVDLVSSASLPISVDRSIFVPNSELDAADEGVDGQWSQFSTATIQEEKFTSVPTWSPRPSITANLLNLSGWTSRLLESTTLQSSITKNGTTWTFDQAYPVGQYCNGDYFVLSSSGVQITSITPESTEVSYDDDPNRVINGCVVNPARENGWDSFRDTYSVNINYDEAANIDPGKTGSAYSASPGESIVKGVSVDSPNTTSGRPSVDRFVVVNVVSEFPSKDQFRPPIAGSSGKDIPYSWQSTRLAMQLLPKYSYSSIDAEDWTTRENYALSTWYTFSSWGNGVRNVTPDSQPGDYRQQIGKEFGACIRAITRDVSDSQKMNTLIGMVQVGIDQSPVVYIDDQNDPDQQETNLRWDIGRRAPSALASLLLDDNEYISNALANSWRWQDTSSFAIINDEIVNAFDDDTEAGATDGTQGFGEWIHSRPTLFTGVSASNHLDAMGKYEWTHPYRFIGYDSVYIGAIASHLITGMDQEYNSSAVLRYLYRVDDMIQAGWPDLSDGSGYFSIANTPSDTEVDWFREVKSDIVPSDTNQQPEMPEPVSLTADSSSVTASATSPYVSHGGGAAEQIDIRYVSVANYSDSNSWTVVEDVSLPYTINGLSSSTEYAVSIRYRNSVGVGAWSRNWKKLDEPKSEPWRSGVITTN